MYQLEQKCFVNKTLSLHNGLLCFKQWKQRLLTQNCVYKWCKKLQRFMYKGGKLGIFNNYNWNWQVHPVYVFKEIVLKQIVDFIILLFTLDFHWLRNTVIWLVNTSHVLSCAVDAYNCCTVCLQFFCPIMSFLSSVDYVCSPYRIVGQMHVIITLDICQ